MSSASRNIKITVLISIGSLLAGGQNNDFSLRGSRVILTKKRITAGGEWPDKNIRLRLAEDHFFTVQREAIKLTIVNEDDEPEEFDSFALNREKVIFGQSKANIFIGPLSPGRYPFFGQYHPTTAQGEVIVLAPGEEAPDAN